MRIASVPFTHASVPLTPIEADSSPAV